MSEENSMEDEYIWYNQFYYSNVCHVCKKVDKNIKRCSACRSLSYCSKEHQVQDWKYHKKLCKIISETDKLLKGAVIKNLKDFIKYKVNCSVVLIEKLQRELLNFENQIWMFPRVCNVCFSKNVSIDCQNCLNASFCSELHENEYRPLHSKYCKSLKLCMDMDLYYFQHKVRPTDIKVRDIVSIQSLPKNLEDLMLLYENSPQPNTSDEWIQFVIKSDYVAPAATILYGLEKCKLVSNRIFQNKHLAVHIVGADITEMAWLWKIMTELPFHWIENLKKLDYYLVGPELNHDGITTKFATQLCKNCRKRNPKTNIYFHSKFYQDVADNLDRPDIIVLYNSGLHEFKNSKEDRWKGALDSLIKYTDVPVLLTAYTLKEILQDVEILRSHNSSVQTILEPQQNPFSNMKPTRDWESENVPVFYINGYIAILASSGK